MDFKSTDWVKNKLLESDNIDDFMDSASASFVEPSFSDRLNALMEEAGVGKGQVVKDSGLSTPYVYELFSGHKVPTRDKLIMLAFGLRVNLDNLQELLKLCNHGPLYPKVKRDAVVMFCINKGLNIFETDEMLFELDEKTFLR